MDYNDNGGCLNARVIRTSIASKPAPTVMRLPSIPFSEMLDCVLCPFRHTRRKGKMGPHNAHLRKARGATNG